MWDCGILRSVRVGRNVTHDLQSATQHRIVATQASTSVEMLAITVGRLATTITVLLARGATAIDRITIVDQLVCLTFHRTAIRN
jgi:hypothetical protein